MLFDNYIIFIYIFLFVVLYNLTKWITTNAIGRNIIIAAGNLFMLLTLVKEHTIIVIAVVSLLVFLSGRILQKNGLKPLLWFILILILALFAIRNYPFIQQLLSASFLSAINAPVLSIQKLGLSYILFRYINWIVESWHKKIMKSNFLCFVNYIFFFPTILAGPIDTYTNFHYWVENKRLPYQRNLFFAGITRIFIGTVKVFAIVPIVIRYATNYKTLIPVYPAAIALLISLVAFSLYIYFNFSGYSDIAIGTAYLIGIRTPENFNNPYISQSLSEFWTRWHQTFSNFLRLYVFKPFIDLFNKWFPNKPRLLITTLCYIITFFICGLWHGAELNFLCWGLWHGIGLTINKVWAVKIRPFLSFCNTKTYAVASTLLTFSYVTIGWLFFHYSMQQLHQIFNMLR